MANQVKVDQLPPTNTELLNYIIEGRKEVRQLQRSVDELTRMVKVMQSQHLNPREDPTRRRFPSEKIQFRESTKKFMLRNVAFSEIEEACNGWCDILGAGGFGEVYKGVWNGQNIAVKRLRNDKRPGDVKGKVDIPVIQICKCLI